MFKQLSPLDRLKIWASVVIVAILLAFLGGFELYQYYGFQSEQQLSFWSFHSATSLNFTSSKATKNKIETLVGDQLTRLDRLYNRYDELTTDDGTVLTNLFQVNRAYGNLSNLTDPWMVLDEDLYTMIYEGHQATLATHGAFNMYVGALVDLWQPYLSIGAGKPSNERIQEALKCVPTYETLLTQPLLQFDAEKLSIRWNNMVNCPTTIGVRISLGAIAKGYATQKIGDQLRDFQIPIFYSGGRSSIRFVYYDDELFEGGLTNPLYEDDPSIGIAKAALLVLHVEDDLGISSSGDYEQFAYVDGVRYHHILDQQTGYSNNYFRGVTVIAKDSTIADILSTALMNLPLKEGQVLIDSYRQKGHQLDVIWVAPETETSLQIYWDSDNLISITNPLFPITKRIR